MNAIITENQAEVCQFLKKNGVIAKPVVAIRRAAIFGCLMRNPENVQQKADFIRIR